MIASSELKPVGQWRRIAGLCLLALGVIVTVRVLWLGASFWHIFDTEDRAHFVFWLWFGLVLMLAGCWAAFVSGSRLGACRADTVDRNCRVRLRSLVDMTCCFPPDPPRRMVDRHR